MFNFKWLFDSVAQFVMAVAIAVIIMAVAIEAYYPSGLAGLLGGI
jgi:hypothetical protein